MCFVLARKDMTLGAVKHEKVAIFRRKMSGFRMFTNFESVKHEEIREHHTMCISIYLQQIQKIRRIRNQHYNSPWSSKF